MAIHIHAAGDNDLVRTLQAASVPYVRHDDPHAALDAASPGDALLLLADGYPAKTNDIPPEVLGQAAAKRLRCYVEYPGAWSGIELGEPRQAELERAVVASPLFGDRLPPDALVALHACRFVNLEPLARQATHHLALAAVAGFDTAAYGLPEADVFPLLVERRDPPMLIAATKLSHFIQGRYGPQEHVAAMWQGILRWLQPDRPPVRLAWTASVHPTHARAEPLPASAQRQAVQRGGSWYRRADMLLFPPGKATDPQAGGVAGLAGLSGVAECFQSSIHSDGTQPRGMTLRNDCTGETAMAMALYGAAENDPAARHAAANLLACVFEHSGFHTGTCADPQHPAYGLMRWSEGSREVFFADDNARSLLGAIVASTALGDDRWDERILRAILANLRTAGPDALQGHNLWEPLLFKYGWRYYFEHDQSCMSPHFEAWILACFLWGYHKTGHAPLLERTRRGIARLMHASPDGWRWTNGIQQERARMLLPLAWLVRVDDTPEHRRWLRRIADDLLAHQDPCGAIAEQLGAACRGLYGVPKNNEAYGKHEAPLIQHNGDPVADLLYTSNFALVSLIEAAAATGDGDLQAAADRLAAFFVRSQTQSHDHPELDGAWYRGFDFRRWEYFASNADGGWGAWCIETGWTQGWIVAMLEWHRQGTSFWDYTAGSTVGRHLPEILPRMFPEKLDAVAASQPSNGFRQVFFHPDDLWTLYVGMDLTATVDLGEAQPVTTLAADLLLAPSLGLVLPRLVRFEASQDGEHFTTVGEVQPDQVQANGDHMAMHRVELALDARGTFRTARIHLMRDLPQGLAGASTLPGAALPGQMPDAMRKRWMFCDSVLVG